MDTATKTRTVSIFCATDNHPYCFDAANPHCDCSCHFEEKFGDADLLNLGYNLWHSSSFFEVLTDEERTEHILGIIRKAEPHIDFQGFTAEEVLGRLQPTLARNYWSRRETRVDLGEELEGYEREIWEKEQHDNI